MSAASGLVSVPSNCRAVARLPSKPSPRVTSLQPRRAALGISSAHFPDRLAIAHTRRPASQTALGWSSVPGARHRRSGTSLCAIVPSMDSGDEESYDDDGKSLDSDSDVPPNNHPRRTALLAFTCDKCGGRTERKVNPDALMKGLVIVQCGECEVWHKIADNQGLIQEFDLRDPAPEE